MLLWGGGNPEATGLRIGLKYIETCDRRVDSSFRPDKPTVAVTKGGARKHLETVGQE